MYEMFGKRLFDIIVSLIGILTLLPLFLLVALWIKSDSKGSVFFIQKRVGKDFKIFDLYKFRSMQEGSENSGPGVTSSDDHRITKVGKFIRKTKIDELPQLFNVLKGDMSLVGPRPELKRYVDLYKDAYEKVLRVKPGITDNAAIIFRNEEELLRRYEDKEKVYIEEILPKKIALYYQYVDTITFANDIELIIKTLKAL